MLCFFRLLIDFDWIEGHLISDRVGPGQVRVGLDQFDFLKKLGRIRTDRTGFSNRVGFCHIKICLSELIDYGRK
jgi:hypothetical protein